MENSFRLRPNNESSPFEGGETYNKKANICTAMSYAKLNDDVIGNDMSIVGDSLREDERRIV